ncbi:MAG: hypothetical protein Kow0074_14910 [Candidatus Zixiibacteriota bacterium]
MTGGAIQLVPEAPSFLQSPASPDRPVIGGPAGPYAGPGWPLPGELSAGWRNYDLQVFDTGSLCQNQVRIPL